MSSFSFTRVIYVPFYTILSRQFTIFTNRLILFAFDRIRIFIIKFWCRLRSMNFIVFESKTLVFVFFPTDNSEDKFYSDPLRYVRIHKSPLTWPWNLMKLYVVLFPFFLPNYLSIYTLFRLYHLNHFRSYHLRSTTHMFTCDML